MTSDGEPRRASWSHLLEPSAPQIRPEHCAVRVRSNRRIDSKIVARLVGDGWDLCAVVPAGFSDGRELDLHFERPPVAPTSGIRLRGDRPGR
jgi:hypothetical protein